MIQETSYEFLTVKDVQNILHVKEAKAYQIIRILNNELKKDGYYVLPGRVNKEKFEERFVYNNISSF
ncbi:ICEBs1 excisionase [Oceanobacillus kimchii]|uniref:ICEBs1 excisionase n=1 Tax=Oceanobacillus kimchii TaxID=746691 RepID=UPI0021A9443C|nr:ICEBs1 excisionase [Oceanobacillus kimchii]MCT1577313.1 ICEBs1 excisionase [Oceanobacillus kimchii]MCT2136919.1 ICEBs1 excisionase [Oceanobacillus kimchii]